MQTSRNSSDAFGMPASREAASAKVARLDAWLPPMLSVVAGMVDLTGFFTLGNVFTAHVTGNLVVATATLLGGEPLRLAEVLAIPVFMLAVAAVWVIAKASGRQSAGLVRLLLLVQSILLATVLMIGVIARPSTQPHGPMAGVAAMIAVAAMACQFALLRVAMPGAISTAVMTGNLTNFVLLSMDSLFGKQSGSVDEQSRVLRTVLLLAGFLCGCGIAALSVRMLADWAWVGPVVLAAVLTLLVV